MHGLWRLLAAALLTLSVSTSQPAYADDQSGETDDMLEGQVVGINTFAVPPIVQIGSLDGTVSLYFRNVDAVAASGIRFGDYISVIGRKLNELEFEVDTVEIDSRVPIVQLAPEPGADVSASEPSYQAAW